MPSSRRQMRRFARVGRQHEPMYVSRSVPTRADVCFSTATLRRHRLVYRTCAKPRAGLDGRGSCTEASLCFNPCLPKTPRPSHISRGHSRSSLQSSLSARPHDQTCDAPVEACRTSAGEHRPHDGHCRTDHNSNHSPASRTASRRFRSIAAVQASERARQVCSTTIEAQITPAACHDWLSNKTSSDSLLRDPD